MGWFPISFTMPFVLVGLFALPLIWYLLRLTPPRPQAEVFPPLRILAQLVSRQETPDRSPWWMTLLRLLLIALVVFALADPVLNKRENLAQEGDALAIIIDNGWASAPDWQDRVATAGRLIDDAEAAQVPVLLAFTAERPNAEIGPFDAQTARDHLRAAEALPVPVDRKSVLSRVEQALTSFARPEIAYLNDGLLGADGAEVDDRALRNVLAKNVSSLIWGKADLSKLVGLANASNEAEGLRLTAIRAQPATEATSISAGAFDERGRRIGETRIAFPAGEVTGTALVSAPFELRNDFSSIALDGQEQAGAVRVLDESAKRRRVGLIAQAESDSAQPLLSPLFYIRKAIAPFADMIEVPSADLVEAVPKLLEQQPAMIIMADIGVLPESSRKALFDWVEKGGTLVRFAGPHLAAGSKDDDLLPVKLRGGERALGGTMSWTEPQALTDYAQSGPFADLPRPDSVTVTRQVLAEPSADIASRTWASLSDGTPLVTGRQQGEGRLVLFHVTPEATWSNLPISGNFVDMLRRIIQQSRNQGRVFANVQGAVISMPPYRMIAADGSLIAPTPDARPLMGTDSKVTIENPPGLYGNEDGVFAHNLLPEGSALTALERPQVSMKISEITYGPDRTQELRGPLFGIALLLLLIDTLATMWLGGAFARRWKRPASTAHLGLLLIAGGFALSLLAASAVLADDAKPGDQEAIEAISTTRIAYVITGDKAIDDISRAGITGLNRFIVEKTALEPGEAAGIDIASDELSFYPLIYWPVDANADMPDEAAMARIDAYMRQGGTVLFDTRDQYGQDFDGPDASPSTLRLRELLADLNVPPLEPVPSDHVLTKSFYMMPDFPGRFTGSPLWIEASTATENSAERPVRVGDGVSPILITANDLAGAWAIDNAGEPLLPTLSGDYMQREYAYRGGVNIMMYMLTGNYKSDQVHVPSLLERLGQ